MATHSHSDDPTKSAMGFVVFYTCLALAIIFTLFFL